MCVCRSIFLHISQKMKILTFILYIDSIYTYTYFKCSHKRFYIEVLLIILALSIYLHSRPWWNKIFVFTQLEARSFQVNTWKKKHNKTKKQWNCILKFWRKITSDVGWYGTCAFYAIIPKKVHCLCVHVCVEEWIYGFSSFLYISAVWVHGCFTKWKNITVYDTQSPKTNVI